MSELDGAKVVLDKVWSKVLIPSDDIIDSNENQYYFILNESFMSRIKAVQEEYPQLIGLYDSYKLRVKIIWK